MLIRLVFMGHGYHQASDWPEQIEVPAGADVTQAVKALQNLAVEPLSLPPTCLVIVNGRHLGTIAHCDACTLTAGDELTLLAPVAGG